MGGQHPKTSMNARSEGCGSCIEEVMNVPKVEHLLFVLGEASDRKRTTPRHLERADGRRPGRGWSPSSPFSMGTLVSLKSSGGRQSRRPSSSC